MITIPQVGVINVNGLSIDDASASIKERMTKTAYRSIASGASKFNIALGNIRSIRITMIGAAKPGNYTISSLSTAFNSLHMAGGPDAINSYREIELRRNNKMIQKIDLYQLLTQGDESGNILLKENDIINFPVYKKRVTITGEVKRPGIFELLENETLNDLIYFAGGFTEKAYAAVIAVKQTTDKERRLKDISKSEFSSYRPGNGDVIEVGAVLDRFENSVSIKGAVYRPGQYELTPGLTLTGLIKRADGLKEDVYTKRGILIRTRDDKTTENIAFSVLEVLRDGANDLILLKDDVINIASVSDFKDTYTVTVDGEVRKPGLISYSSNLSLKDALFSTGGYTDAATAYRIEISRRYNNEGLKISSDSIARVYIVDSEKDLALEDNFFILHPFDIITVRRKPGYSEQKRVSIEGEVLFPGSYTLERKGDRISNLLKRAGGLTTFAHIESVFLIRKAIGSILKEDKVEQIVMLQLDANDSTEKTINDVLKPTSNIPINIKSILEQPGTNEDYVLQEGDVIHVLKYDPLVKISGQVMFSTKTSYMPGLSFTNYLGKAGGATDKAQISKSYVLYPNGQVSTTKRILFGLFRKYPEIKPGSEIIIPAKKDRRPINTAEIIGIGSTIASLATLILIGISYIK